MTLPGIDLDRAAEVLGHPLGKRRADDKLARAAITGTLGRKPSASHSLAALGSLSDGLRWRRAGTAGGFLAELRNLFRRRVETPRTSRRWYLRRSEQRDQGDTPHCVAFTQKHWELAVPTITRKGLDPAEMYARCKAIDPWPTEDGTSAEAMLTVCQELGIVQSHWWWTGPQDTEAARRWAIDVGPLWVGVNLPESFFRPDDKGIAAIEEPFLYGHEMLVIGYDGRKKLWELTNSWGDWGINGRCFVRDADFLRLMEAGGDLVGVVEAKR